MLWSRDIVDDGIGTLWREGIDGTGTTIAVMVEWNDPSIDKVVASVDRPVGLPNPQITTIYPSGDHRLPARCPAAMVAAGDAGGCAGWRDELELDVASAHLIAPYAKIVIAVTPADGSAGEDPANAGTPEMLQGIETVSREHVANVISISGGSGEVTYRYGRDEVTAQDPSLLTAAAAGVPVVAATGDCGPVASAATAKLLCTPVTRQRDISTPSDSPWTLAVVGSQIPSRVTDVPDSTRIVPGILTGSAGFSVVYRRPAYQNGVASITRGRMRSVPDITMDDTAGTSESAPLMAGVLALATQVNGGHDLGPINSVLYDTLGPRGAADGISDITRGNDSLLGAGGRVRARGFTAHRGFDVASGWGTIYAPRFVPDLVAATRASHDEQAARTHAASALAALSHAMRLAPAAVTRDATSRLIATGFEPRLPVTLSIDGHRIAALHADDSGDVRDTIAPSTLHLGAGTHTITLHSVLITITGRLTIR